MSRLTRQLKRNPPSKGGERLLIITEGTKTEPQYFNLLLLKYRISPKQVSIQAGSSSDPKLIIEEAKQLKRVNHADANKGRDAEYDEVWAVFDTEGMRPHLSQAIDQAGQNGIKLAISAPSFEYWLLLHYELTTRYMCDADEVIRELKDFMPDYDKGNSMRTHNVIELTEQALKNAANVRKGQENLPEPFPLPSTTVDNLVRRIIGLKT